MKRAKSELNEATDYIQFVLMNEISADNLYDKVNIAVAKLASNPSRRPFVKNKRLAAKGLRLYSVGNYNIFYVVCEESKRVYIISFMYARRNWERLFRDTDFEDLGELK
jgi:mRNA-degrading endonuclease RelE of RelBE toxin-antitoxin system